MAPSENYVIRKVKGGVKYLGDILSVGVGMNDVHTICLYALLGNSTFTFMMKSIFNLDIPLVSKTQRIDVLRSLYSIRGWFKICITITSPGQKFKSRFATQKIAGRGGGGSQHDCKTS